MYKSHLLITFSLLSVQSTFVLRIPQGTIMKIRSMQTCIMSSLPRCIFRCSVFRYVTLDNFFKLCYLIVISFTLVANKYLLTYLLIILLLCDRKLMSWPDSIFLSHDKSLDLIGVLSCCATLFECLLLRKMM